MTTRWRLPLVALVIVGAATTACDPVATIDPSARRQATDRGLAAAVLADVPAAEVTGYGGSSSFAGDDELSAYVDVQSTDVQQVFVFATPPRGHGQVPCHADPGTAVVACERHDGIQTVLLRGDGTHRRPVASGYASRQDGSLMGVEVFGPTASTTATALAQRVLDDPDVGWTTTAALDHHGATLSHFRAQHLVVTESRVG